MVRVVRMVRGSTILVKVETSVEVVRSIVRGAPTAQVADIDLLDDVIDISGDLMADEVDQAVVASVVVSVVVDLGVVHLNIEVDLSQILLEVATDILTREDKLDDAGRHLEGNGSHNTL